MKKSLFTAIALFMTGCMAPYVPLTVAPFHPGSRDAEESPMYPASTTLDKQKEDLKNKHSEQKSVHSGHSNHASH